MQNLLIHLLAAFLIGWVSAWNGIAFLHMTGYYGIFGRLKLWIIRSYFDQSNEEMLKKIISNGALSTDMQSNQINEMIYDEIAKRSVFVKLISCHYCMAIQFMLYVSVSWCAILQLTWTVIPMIFMGTASVYFNLNYAK